MDARMLVVSADRGLVELLRPQVENVGCDCRVADCEDEVPRHLRWAEAMLVDLELPEGGLEVLRRVRTEAPDIRIVAVATTEADAAAARNLGAHEVLLEPFSITDVVDAVRAVGKPVGARVIDLREKAGARLADLEPDDRPWFATQ